MQEHSLKTALRSVAYRVPGAQRLWTGVNRLVRAAPAPEFSGWGMQTDAFTPWHAGGGDDTARDFLRTNDEVVRRVATGELVLSQFAGVPDVAAKLRELMWRHYLVFWTARYAADATSSSPVKHLVECGVCDGLSSFFAMSAVSGRHPFRAFLYDAWQAMERRYLLESEEESAGAYGYLSIETAKRNLAPFDPHAVFIKGFVPDVFAQSTPPSELVWLHLDMNSSKPTTAALEALVPRMPPGSVVLLDDYAWRGFYDTKVAVDRFVAPRRGLLLPMPTGQGVFFNL